MMFLKNIKMTKRLLLILGQVLFLFACTSFPSVNSDPAKNNRAVFQKDLAECKEDHPESSVGLHYKRWAECMNLKGWK